MHSHSFSLSCAHKRIISLAVSFCSSLPHTVWLCSCCRAYKLGHWRGTHKRGEKTAEEKQSNDHFWSKIQRPFGSFNRKLISPFEKQLFLSCFRLPVSVANNVSVGLPGTTDGPQHFWSSADVFFSLKWMSKDDCVTRKWRKQNAMFRVHHEVREEEDKC